MSDLPWPLPLTEVSRTEHTWHILAEHPGWWPTSGPRKAIVLMHPSSSLAVLCVSIVTGTGPVIKLRSAQEHMISRPARRDKSRAFSVPCSHLHPLLVLRAQTNGSACHSLQRGKSNSISQDNEVSLGLVMSADILIPRRLKRWECSRVWLSQIKMDRNAMCTWRTIEHLCSFARMQELGGSCCKTAHGVQIPLKRVRVYVPLELQPRRQMVS